MSVSLFWQAFSISSATLTGRPPSSALEKKERGVGGEISGEKWQGLVVWDVRARVAVLISLLTSTSNSQTRGRVWCEAGQMRGESEKNGCLFQISFKKKKLKKRNDTKWAKERIWDPSCPLCNLHPSLLLLLLVLPFPLYVHPPPSHPLFKNHAFKWKKGPLGQAKGHRSRFFPRLDNWLPSPGNSSLAYAA